MESHEEINDYRIEELEFVKHFKPEGEGYKRIYSLKFKTTNVSDKWLELKNKCENNDMMDWLNTNNLSKNLSFKENNDIWNSVYNTIPDKIGMSPDFIWNNTFYHDDDNNDNSFYHHDKCITMVYYEHVPMEIFNKMKASDDYSEKFKFFWNKDVLNPILDNFINYANNYILEESVVGKIEFVNNGNNVSITYLG